MADKRRVLVNFETRNSPEVAYQLQVDLTKMPDLSNDRERIKKAIADQKEFTLLPNEEFHLLFESQDFPGAIVQFPDSPLRHLAVVRARIKEKPSSKKCQNSSNQSNASGSFLAHLRKSLAFYVFL